MKFQYSRTVANGDLYLCPCCGEEIFIEEEESPFATYCDSCGAEFNDDIPIIAEPDADNKRFI